MIALATEEGADLLDTEEAPLMSPEDEAAAFFEMQEMAQRTMEDPREASYFKRMDTKDVVRSQEEYDALIRAGVPLKLIGYRQALTLLDQTKASRAKRVKNRAKVKAARKSKARNRR